MPIKIVIKESRIPLRIHMGSRGILLSLIVSEKTDKSIVKLLIFIYDYRIISLLSV